MGRPITVDDLLDAGIDKKNVNKIYNSIYIYSFLTSLIMVILIYFKTESY